ncbi:MAG: hypothetical protein DDT27_01260 [Dehalococcoidia bacterium]|nr:hypothetical protein [Chloroflexota bacterium]MBT9160616.1 hypothetical protein [Chloroflexota bacterium]MBT9162698.1 hypothetical protein [Chloroflexota bacterium]
MGEVYYPRKMPGLQPALCICHGIPAAPANPRNRGYPLLAERFAAEGFITCIFNFRGTGESEGNLDLLGWTRDLQSVVDYIIQLDGVDLSRISLIGFSGGAATSAYVTARDQRISALVTCACPAEFSIFTTGERLAAFLDQCRSVGTIRDDDFPRSIAEWGDHLRQVNPMSSIEKVSPRPLLMIHGENDDLIPPSHAQRLYEKAEEPKELVMIPGGEHQLRTNETAIRTAVNWLKRLNDLGN